MEKIMQGDAYAKPLTITLNSEQVSQDEVVDIEIFIADCRKTLKNGDIEYSESEGWTVFFSQEDTFSMHEGKQHFQIRVKFSNGEIIGARGPDIEVVRSNSKEIL